MSNSTSGAVLCVGRVYCDLVFAGVPRVPSMGTEVFAEGLTLFAGGGAFISAAYFAALGRPAYLAATLSGPPFGSVLGDEAKAAGIDISLCVPAKAGDDPQVTAVIVGTSDRAFLSRTSGVAAPIPTVDDLLSRGISHMHIGELRTAIELPALLSLARKAGVTVSLDCGWEDMPDPNAAEIIAQVDVFLPNAHELAHLDASGIAINAPICVVKMGADGARIVGGAKRPGRKVKSLDTTGAGDAFNAGFLHNWLDGKHPERCLEAGNSCGAAAVQYAGGCGGTRALAALNNLAAQ